MDDVAADIINRERELADFDHARDDFLAAPWATCPKRRWITSRREMTIPLRDLISHVTASIKYVLVPPG